MATRQTDTKTTPPPDPAPQPDPAPEPGGPDIASTVRKVFSEEIGKLFSTGAADVSEGSTKDTAPAGQQPNIGAEVRNALGELKRAEEAERAAGQQEERLSAVEKALEQSPRQFRKVEKLMGWHEDGDD